MEVDNFISIYNNNKKVIDKNLQKYYLYIKSDPDTYNQFKDIVRSGRKSLSQKGGYSTEILAGLGATTLGISSSSLIFTIIVGVGLYLVFSKKTCLPEYPLVSHDEPITFQKLLYVFLPPDFIPKDELEKPPSKIMNKDLSKALENLMNVTDGVDDQVVRIISILDKLDSIISVIDPESTLGQVAMRTLQTALGAIATVAGVGIPLDIIVNLVFTIKDAIAFVIKILNLVSYIFKILKQICPAEREILMFYIYDILNINFETGPIGVKCQYEYIKQKYPTHETLDLILCKLFAVVYMKFTAFLSNAISTSIPYNFGLVSHAIYLILKSGAAKNAAFNIITKKTIKFYNKVPPFMKKTIQSPTGLGDMIRCTFDPYIFKLIHENLEGAIKRSIRKAGPLGINPAGFAMVAAFNVAQGITNIASKAITGKTPKDMIMSGLLSLFGLSLDDVLASPMPSYCKGLIKQKKKLKDILFRTVPEDFDETVGTLDMDRPQLFRILIKYGGLFGFLIHKLLAFSFLLLFVFKGCPIGTKLDKKYDDIMNKECPALVIDAEPDEPEEIPIEKVIPSDEQNSGPDVDQLLDSIPDDIQPSDDETEEAPDTSDDHNASSAF